MEPSLFRYLSLALLLSWQVQASCLKLFQPVDPAAKENYEYLIRGQFSQYEDKLKATQDILSAAQAIADSWNIRYVIEELSTEVGDLKKYPALRILPEGDSVANREAALLEKEWGGLKLYLSPYDLKRSGSNAFFNPDGSMIGVPHDFVYGVLSESYHHEKLHAETFLRLIKGSDETLAGSFRLVKGETMSERYHGGYFRHASIDEVLATELSAKLNAKSLGEIFRTTERAAFLAERSNEKLLSELKHNLEEVVGLAKLNRDLLVQAREKILAGTVKGEATTVKLGERLSAEVTQFEILVAASQRVYQRGRGDSVPVPEGTRILLRANEKDPASLVPRIDALVTRMDGLIERYEQALKLIGVRIEFADLAKTDVAALLRAMGP